MMNLHVQKLVQLKDVLYGVTVLMVQLALKQEVKQGNL
jgi:hypothetical protein